jgi:hypothetical protein
VPVSYLWPLSSARLFADWRPIHSPPVHMAHLLSGTLLRLKSEFSQLIIPMIAAAVLVRAVRTIAKR